MTPKEYNQCVEEYADNVFRFIASCLKDKDEAQNVVQNTFEKIWIRREDIIYSKVRGYIFKIAYNQMLDVIKYKKRFVSLEVAKNYNLKASETNYTGIREVLDKLVNTLSEPESSVILLRDYEGYDFKTISEITGLTEKEVKYNLYKARRHLKDKIGKIEVFI